MTLHPVAKRIIVPWDVSVPDSLIDCKTINIIVPWDVSVPVRSLTLAKLQLKHAPAANKFIDPSPFLFYAASSTHSSV